MLLRYLDGGTWYERVIVLHSHGHEYWVLSPEFDLFPAILRMPPLSAVRLLPPSRELPQGIGADEVVQFVSVGDPSGFFTYEQLIGYEVAVRSLLGLEDVDTDRQLGVNDTPPISIGYGLTGQYGDLKLSVDLSVLPDPSSTIGAPPAGVCAKAAPEGPPPMFGPCDFATPQLKAPPPTPPGPVFSPMLRQDSRVPNVEPALGTSGSSDTCQSLDDSRLGTGEEAIEPAGERTEVMGRQPKDVSNRYLSGDGADWFSCTRRCFIHERGHSCPYQSSMPPSASSHPIRFGYDAQTALAPAIPLGSEAGGAEDGDERISPRLWRNVSEVMESLAKVLEVQQEQKDLKNKAKILEQSREAREERASHLERAPTGQGDGSGGASASNPQPQGPANPLPKVTPGRGIPRAGARKSSLERSDSGSRGEAAAGF